MKKKLLIVIVAILGLFGATNNTVKDEVAGGFHTIRGFATLESSVRTDIVYHFGVVDIPADRVGAASSSTGYEFGKLLTTNTTAFTVASTSSGFAITMNKTGKIKGCSFDLQAAPTTGTVSLMIQQNGTLLAGKYCKLPASGNFATNGGFNAISTNQTFLSDNISLVAGDRIGLIASSSGLNAATIDGNAELIIQLNNN